jgi:hypothetical protein
MRSINIAVSRRFSDSLQRGNKLHRIHLLNVFWLDIAASEASQTLGGELGVMEHFRRLSDH